MMMKPHSRVSTKPHSKKAQRSSNFLKEADETRGLGHGLAACGLGHHWCDPWCSLPKIVNSLRRSTVSGLVGRFPRSAEAVMSWHNFEIESRRERRVRWAGESDAIGNHPKDVPGSRMRGAPRRGWRLWAANPCTGAGGWRMEFHNGIIPWKKWNFHGMWNVWKQLN